MKSTQTKPSIVFCHGLWADGSCFSKVIPTLQAEGHQVIAAQYALNTTADDIASVKSALGRVKSPAILVGHSYGGSVITGAGTDDRVAGLVYIAALAPDADETSQTQLSKFPTTDVFSFIEVADGRIWLRQEGIDTFAGDLSDQEKKLVWATQCVPVADLFNAKVEERLGNRSQVGTSSPRTTVPFPPISNASMLSGWVPRRRRSPAATLSCSLTRTR